MSLSLAKKSIRDFEVQESSVKVKKGKKSKLIKVSVKDDKETIENEKIKKLLMLNSCIDDKLSKKLLKTVMKTKRARRPGRGKLREKKPKEPESTSIFTEEDFKNFEEDYGNEQLN